MYEVVCLNLPKGPRRLQSMIKMWPFSVSHAYHVLTRSCRVGGPWRCGASMRR